MMKIYIMDGDISYLSLLNFLLILALVGMVIYVMVRQHKMQAKMDDHVASIKSKIGSLIRDVNLANTNEYAVDLEQSANIKALQGVR